MLQYCKAMEDTWLGVLSTIGVNHKGPDRSSQPVSLFPFPPYSPWTRQDTEGNSPFTDYFTISQTSQVLGDKRREQTGSHHHYNKDRACAPPAEVSLHGLIEFTSFKWVWNYGWVISIHLPQLNPGPVYSVLIWSWFCAFTAVVTTGSVSESTLYF